MYIDFFVIINVQISLQIGFIFGKRPLDEKLGPRLRQTKFI
jgi:hypothetical protein